MDKLTIGLEYYKSTKGTHVYKTTIPTAAISQVYIKRDALPIVPPSAIEIDLRWIEE